MAKFSYGKEISLQVEVLFRSLILYGESSSPVSEKYMETYFRSNVAGGCPALKSYKETRLHTVFRKAFELSIHYLLQAF